jgi:hypothetical protein
MYSTCLFCTQPLGRNELVEAFPVGRRLAFDAARGRLWVVCPKCERWNLTPLEERWEAIEQCERLFRDTRLRVSTEQVGLARLREGLVLVRIGAPQRPELAAWRYGDQFGRRRRKYALAVAGAGVVGVGIVVAGPVMGIVGAGAISPAIQLLNAANAVYQSKRVTRVDIGDARPVAVSRKQMGKAVLTSHGDREWSFRLVHSRPDEGQPWWKLRTTSGKSDVERVLTGAAAVRAAGAILPRFNESGASGRGVQEAVGLLERARDPEALYAQAAAEMRRRFRQRAFQVGEQGGLKQIPHAMRLALEMAAHEEQERRALEGELAELERAWQDAEEIAKIADDMFLPSGVTDFIQRHRK